MSNTLSLRRGRSSFRGLRALRHNPEFARRLITIAALNNLQSGGLKSSKHQVVSECSRPEAQPFSPCRVKKNICLRSFIFLQCVVESVEPCLNVINRKFVEVKVIELTNDGSTTFTNLRLE